MGTANQLFELIARPAQLKLEKAAVSEAFGKWTAGKNGHIQATVYHLYLLGNRPARNGEYALTAAGKIKQVDLNRPTLWQNGCRPVLASTDEDFNQSVPTPLPLLGPEVVSFFLAKKGFHPTISLLVDTTTGALRVTENNEVMVYSGQRVARPQYYTPEQVDRMLSQAYFHAWINRPRFSENELPDFQPETTVFFEPNVEEADAADFAYTQWRRAQGLTGNNGHD